MPDYTVLTIALLACLVVNSTSYDKYTIEFYPGNRNNVTMNTEPFMKINDSYYYFGMHAVNWYVAYEKCRVLKSELVTFETAEEFEAIVNYLTVRGEKRDFWTSGNDLGFEGLFNWFTTGQGITISKWAPRQPDNYQGKENCMHMGYVWPDSTEYQLNDRPCTDYFIPYICEAPAQETISLVVWK
ncbi:uncharacterized protein Dwil_GK23834 [Drosophila willistoni]|uniref:C-type lectin domain-containing protein n=1 Tax=Drosophila willistoni TaxID=7260 RepID=B4MTG8_DROWI|nr:C-type lectin 37Da [Drosophila willistoni]EDW75407.1 uncharacterized protein Dwil_GK23834 [Drosophila willistoni]